MGALTRMVKDAKDIGGPLSCPNTSLEMSSFLATLYFASDFEIIYLSIICFIILAPLDVMHHL